jgi:hypothetical protein
MLSVGLIFPGNFPLFSHCRPTCRNRFFALWGRFFYIIILLILMVKLCRWPCFWRKFRAKFALVFRTVFGFWLKAIKNFRGTGFSKKRKVFKDGFRLKIFGLFPSGGAWLFHPALLVSYIRKVGELSRTGGADVAKTGKREKGRGNREGRWATGMGKGGIPVPLHQWGHRDLRPHQPASRRRPTAWQDA